MWARPKEAVQGGALPHKNNLIGTAAGGVPKSFCLKLITSSKTVPFHPRSSTTCSFVDDLEAPLDTRLLTSGWENELSESKTS